MSDEAIDHEARRQITQLSTEQARITTTLEALMLRMDREGKATERALNSHAEAMNALAARINKQTMGLATDIADAKIHMALQDGKNVTRWAILGAGILAMFTMIGWVASTLAGRLFP